MISGLKQAYLEPKITLIDYNFTINHLITMTLSAELLIQISTMRNAKFCPGICDYVYYQGYVMVEIAEHILSFTRTHVSIM
jgi:hypothetical protein